MRTPIRFELTLTPETAAELKRLAEAYGATISEIVRSDIARDGKSMLGSRRIVDQIDDDFLRRLVRAIEEASGAYDDERPDAEVVEECIDGDLFLAYQEVRAMMATSYPELYGND